MVAEASLRELHYTHGRSHVVVFVYKYRHLEHVIRSIHGDRFSVDVVTSWLRGKMLGYSEGAISEWLNEHENKKEVRDGRD